MLNVKLLAAAGLLAASFGCSGLDSVDAQQDGTASAPLIAGDYRNTLVSLNVTTPGYSDRYLRHEDGLGVTSVISSSSDEIARKDASFWVRPGLASASCYSFESRNYPGQYLRHSNYRLRKDVNDGSNVFKGDATFCPRSGLSGTGLSFESYNLPGRFLRHINAEVYISQSNGTNPWDGGGSFNADVSWNMVTAFWRSGVDLPINQIRTFQVTPPGYTNRVMRHSNGLAITSAIDGSDGTGKLDATFTARRGLADPSCYSFQSVNYPNDYLRQSGFRVRKDGYDGTDQFKSDATFCAQPGLAGHDISLAAYAFPGKYLRHKNGEVWIGAVDGSDPGDGSPASFAADATWHPLDGLSRGGASFPYPDTTWNEPMRNQFHYSPQGGWMNDINGTLFYNGVYHLFVQSYPYGLAWDEMRWAHATSLDLVHWTQEPIALDPGLINATLWSGAGVVDTKNTSGLQGSSPYAPLVFFTGIDGVNVAYSTDAGVTFRDGGRIIEGGVKRDHKVFWHDPTQKWVMVSYKEDGGAGVKFRTSVDLLHWTETSSFTASWLFECPDMFELPVDGNAGNRKWVLLNAGLNYVIGKFDGTKFTAEAGPFLMDQGPVGVGAAYAGMTFSNMPDGRTVQMLWMGANHGDNWTGNASFPVELKLKTYAEGVRVAKYPVAEIRSAYTQSLESSNRTITPAPSSDPLQGVKMQSYDISAEFDLTGSSATAFGVKLHVDNSGTAVDKVEYNVAGRTLYGASLAPDNNRIKMRILVDRDMLEIFGNDGHMAYTANRFFESRPDNQGISVYAEGGSVKLVSLSVNQIGSIWGNADVSPGTASAPVNAFSNHDFEAGNLSGWNPVGNAFVDSDVTNKTTATPGNNQAFNASGTYHYWGYGNGDGSEGSIASGVFTLGGSGLIDFLISGGADIEHQYLALVRASDGAVLMKATGNNAETYRRVTWDASAYLGQELYLKAADYVTGSWGHINLDDINLSNLSPGLKVDDTDGRVTYSGSWTACSNESPYYNGTCHYSSTSGGYVEYAFTGTSITWYGLKNTDLGKADVYIDGNLAASGIDCFSFTRASQRLFTQTGLSNGKHTIRVVVTGRKNSGSTGTALVHDSFEVRAPLPSTRMTVDDADSRSAYAGTWNACNEGIYFGNTCHYGNTAGGSVSSTFTGTQISWYGLKNSDLGKADVYIDGGLVASGIDCYSTTREVQRLFLMTGLTNGSHTIKVVVSGQKNAASSNTWLVHDSFEAS